MELKNCATCRHYKLRSFQSPCNVCADYLRWESKDMNANRPLCPKCKNPFDVLEGCHCGEPTYADLKKKLEDIKKDYENYTSHYVNITKETYEELINKEQELERYKIAARTLFGDPYLLLNQKTIKDELTKKIESLEKELADEKLSHAKTLIHFNQLKKKLDQAPIRWITHSDNLGFGISKTNREGIYSEPPPGDLKKKSLTNMIERRVYIVSVED